jgi:hypothetical protein
MRATDLSRAIVLSRTTRRRAAVRWTALSRAAVLVLTAFAACVDTPLDLRDTAVETLEPELSRQAIAFASTRGGRGSWPDIYLAASDGSGVTRLALGTAPTWEPNGRRIAFHREANPYDRAGIYITSAGGSGVSFLTVGSSPAWGPTGRIAFASAGIAVIEPDGSGYRRLIGVEWASAGNACDDPWVAPAPDQPAWSPDGERIVFALACAGEWSELYVMNADGTGRRLLVPSRHAYAPAWSPDGTRIGAYIDGAVTTIDVAGGAQHARHPAHGRKLAWLDARRLLFEAGDPDVRRIFVLDVETGTARQFVPATEPGYYADFDVAVRMQR